MASPSCSPTPSPTPPHRPIAWSTGGRGESPLSKFLIGGAVTIALEMSGGHMLEFLKIAKQTSTDSYFTIMRRMTATKGLAGVLDGFLPWGLLQAVAKGSVFAWGQAASMNALRPIEGFSMDAKMVISGGVGGLVQGMAMSPLLLLKTRVMTDASFRSSGGMLETARASASVGGRIIRAEGGSALFKGVTLFSLKRAADWMSRYFFVILVENALRESGGPGAAPPKLSYGAEAFASLAGGTLSALSTIPMDVLVAAKQSAGAAGKDVGFFSTLSDKVKADGLFATLRYSTTGLGARVLHVAVTTLAMKQVTSVVYDLLYPIPA